MRSSPTVLPPQRMHPLPTITAAASQLRQGQLTSTNLVEHCLKQIKRREPHLRAWVRVDEQGALATAAELDQLAARGEFRGPLHGIPIGIKDIIDVQGLPTLAGSPLRAGHVAARDATVVARLRQAGAIILGKTETTQFASFDPPPTRNPWNPQRTPGGSSSGSAAAVAAGMCWGAVGSQTGGSITRPASFCGVASCKPTYGRVSLFGILPLSFHLDHPGPLARNVADVALLLQVLAGYDPADSISADVAAQNYTLGLKGLSRPPRMAVLGGFFIEHLDAPIRPIIQAAIEKLRERGAELAFTTLESDLPTVLDQHRRIMAVEAAEYHRPWFPARREAYAPHISRLIDEGRACTSLDYAAALRMQIDFRRQVLLTLKEYDALVLSATTTTAPTGETTGNPAFNSPWSFCGFPTLSVPCGLANDGLPVSLQFVGRPFAEAELLSVAGWSERAVAFEESPPLDA